LVPTTVRLYSINYNASGGDMDLTVLILVAMFLVYMYFNNKDDWRG